MLGVLKSEIAVCVMEAIEELNIAAANSVALEWSSKEDMSTGKSHKPVISFAEPDHQETPYENSNGEHDDTTFGIFGVKKTPSEN